MDKIMLKGIITVVMLLIISNCYGQKCEVKKDPITGEKVCQFINGIKTLGYINRGEDLTEFYYTLNYEGERNIIMPKGSQIIFKLKNGEIITIKSIREGLPKSVLLGGSMVMTHYTLSFLLTKKEVNALANNELVFMRYPSNHGGTLDHDFKGVMEKAFVKKIKSGAKYSVT